MFLRPSILLWQHLLWLLLLQAHEKGNPGPYRSTVNPEERVATLREGFEDILKKAVDGT